MIGKDWRFIWIREQRFMTIGIAVKYDNHFEQLDIRNAKICISLDSSPVVTQGG